MTQTNRRNGYTFKEGLTMMAAKAVGIDPYLAAEAGEGAKAAINAIRHAAKVKNPKDRAALIRQAQTELRSINAAKHPKVVNAIQARLLALQGRGGDTEIAHVTPGEVVLPRSLQTPQLMQQIASLAASQGIDPRDLIVGGQNASINPQTGVEEFGFWSDLGDGFSRGIKSLFGVSPLQAKEPESSKNNTEYMNTEAERRQSILQNTPGKITVEESGASVWKPSFEPLGRSFVKKYGETVDRIAKEEGVDPNLVKTMMYAENARGHKFGLGYIADKLGASDSVHPMNVNPEIWGGLGIDKKSAYDPETNIRAATKLIGRTWDRLEQPTAGKLASLYEGLSRDKVSEYGAYAQRVHDERPWEKDSFEDARRSGYRGR